MHAVDVSASTPRQPHREGVGTKRSRTVSHSQMSFRSWLLLASGVTQQHFLTPASTSSPFVALPVNPQKSFYFW